MGNQLCTPETQTQITDGGKCYKVNGKEACDYSNFGMNSFSAKGGIISCVISAIVIFIIMDRKKTSGKLMLGLTIGCAISSIISFITNELQMKQIIKDKPSC
jgi:hypothetical protein